MLKSSIRSHQDRSNSTLARSDLPRATNQDFGSERTSYPKENYQVIQGAMEQSLRRRSHVGNGGFLASSLPRASSFPLKRRFTPILYESHHLLKEICTYSVKEMLCNF